MMISLLWKSVWPVFWFTLVVPSVSGFVLLSPSAPANTCPRQPQDLLRLFASSSPTPEERRQREIQQKINQLKKAGKIKPKNPTEEEEERPTEGLSSIDKLRQNRKKLKSGSVLEDYQEKLQDRLGRKSAYLGIKPKKKSDDEYDDDDDDEYFGRKAQIGSLPSNQDTSDDEEEGYKKAEDGEKSEFNIFNPDLFKNDEEEDEDGISDLDEEELVMLVAEKLRQKRELEKQEEDRARAAKMEQLKKERLEREAEEAAAVTAGGNNSTTVSQTTSSVGGSWTKNTTAAQETYRPSRGSWGYFERPKDISKAYGGGRRVGAGYMKDGKADEDYDARVKRRMKEYRIKMGIESETEKKHEAEINEAVRIAKRAMERGVYTTAVSALVKVSPWCSSNSKLGSQVFLELAMAYEAAGRPKEAIQVYKNLSNCRVEQVRNNAKRLLYGIESYEFMKNDARIESFHSQKIRTTFIETTGMDNFAMHFDDVYNTAYIDRSSESYKRLTQNVVRSVRESRQILLSAVSSGIVSRTKIVQALRSLSRKFDEALREERLAAERAKQPVAMMDGKPIVAAEPETKKSSDEFELLTPEGTLENLNGEWRLQLIADQTGDGVQFFNTTVAWQLVDTDSMVFTSEQPPVGGFLRVGESGDIQFEDEKRIVRRSNVESTNGGVFAGLFSGKGGASNRIAQQIITADSIFLITRCAETAKWEDEEKNYFGVWRRVNEGTYSSMSSLSATSSSSSSSSI